MLLLGTIVGLVCIGILCVGVPSASLWYGSKTQFLILYYGVKLQVSVDGNTRSLGWIICHWMRTLRIIVLILSIAMKFLVIFLLVHCSTLTTIRTPSLPHFNVTCPPLFLLISWTVWFHSVLCIVLISYVVLIFVTVFSQSSPLTVRL